jgi:ADP-ribosylglycohydrolase
MTNRQLLEQFFTADQIDLRRGPVFDTAPGPLPAGFDFGRIEGMMLGLAVGDALGATTESVHPEKRRAQYGEIRDYLPNRHAGGQPVGLPTDDTQLACWTLEQMIEDRGFVPERVAARFCRQWIFGIGSSVREFVACYKSGGKEWYRCGAPSAGNGALMRIAPMLIPHLKTGTSELWVDTALSAMITHNDSASIASCLAVVGMLRQLVEMEKPPEPYWWPRAFVALAEPLERRDTYQPRGGYFQNNYQGTLSRFVQEKVTAAYEGGLSTLQAGQAWFSGAYLLETVPSVLYILMRHGHDFEEAVVRAVNDTRDNDTIAAIVGALAGALHGRRKIPERWLAGLPGRTSYHDDGRVFELLGQARSIWWG